MLKLHSFMVPLFLKFITVKAEDTPILRTLTNIPNCALQYKFTHEMRTPLFSRHLYLSHGRLE